MSNKKDVRRERELQQFVLNRKTENMRNELYEYMIMRVIFDHAVDSGTFQA